MQEPQQQATGSFSPSSLIYAHVDVIVGALGASAAAIAAAPAIADVLAAITATGAGLTRMSGSGATCFGIYETAGAARAASSQLCAQHPDWWIVPCQINDGVNVAPQAMRATT